MPGNGGYTPRRSDQGPDAAINRGQQASRSGQVRYGTSNNGFQTQQRFRIERAPTIVNGSGLPGRVYRQDRVGIVDGYRQGYYHYNRSFRDDYFWYPYYNFSPFGGFQTVCSPFYNYAFVPPYLSYNRVIFSNYASPWAWNSGTTIIFRGNTTVVNGGNNYDNGAVYNNGNSRDDQAYQAARNAVDDLRDSFEDGDPRLVSRLLPRQGQVAILRDGKYDYSLNVTDFEDLIRDLVTNSRTRRYTVEDSRAYRDSVRLVMRHDYQDPWGERQTMFHHILLTPERGQYYVIREFGTSPTRDW